jgi:hypothetical protein
MARHFTKELGRTPKNEDIFALSVGDQSVITMALSHYKTVVKNATDSAAVEGRKEELAIINKLQKVLIDAAETY